MSAPFDRLERAGAGAVAAQDGVPAAEDASRSGTSTMIALFEWWSGNAATAILLAGLLCLLRDKVSFDEWALRVVFMTAPLVTVAFCTALLYPLRRRIGFTHKAITVPLVVGITAFMLGTGTSVWLAKFEYPYSLLSARGLVLLLFFLAATIVVAVGLAILAGRSRLLARVGAWRLGTVMALGLALLFNTAGRHLDLSPFWPLRYSNSLLLGLLILASAALARRVGWARRPVVYAGVVVALLSFGRSATLDRDQAHRAYTRLLADGGNARRILMLMRRLGDRDGNGWSTWFDGGDCDEGNLQAYPLGPIDCSHLALARAAPPPVLPQAQAPRVKRVLLATIDTLRCELDGHDLCEDLEQLGATASYRGRQRVFMGQTPRSLGVLLGAPYVVPLKEAARRPSYTIERARAAGYRTKVFYTIDILDSPSLAGSFDERDDTLGKGLSHPESMERIFARRLTDRVITDMEGHLGDAAPSLRWVHYLDPHETYVPTEEDAPVPWLRYDREGAYRVEMRRTEKQVARLIERARALGYDRDAAIVVTGDHGENFHAGRLYHGTTAGGEDLDVPVYAWIYDAEGRAVKVDLPPRIYERDVAGLLAALVGAPAPPGQSEISVVDQNDGDRQFVVTDGRWEYVYHQQMNYTELFDRAADPTCQTNLVFEQPAEAARLRSRLSEQIEPFVRRAEPGSGTTAPL